MVRSVCVYVSLLVLLAACGGGGSSPVVQNATNNPPPAAQSPQELSVTILDPGSGSLVTNQATLPVGGVTTGPVESISWVNAAGGNGSLTPGANFSGDIPLQAGDNAIAITTTGDNKLAVDTLLVTFDPAAQDVSPLAVHPPGMFVNDTQEVMVSLTVDLDTDITAVEAWKVEIDGTPIAKLVDMGDDGRRATGDEEENDDIFTGRFDYTSAGVERCYFRVKIDHAGGTLWTPHATFDVVDHIDVVAYIASLDLQEAALDLYRAQLPVDGHEAASLAALVFVQSDPLVKWAERTSDLGGISIRYTAGFTGALLLSPPDTKASNSGNCAPAPANSHACIAPFHEDFAERLAASGRPQRDEAETIFEILLDKDCLPFDPVSLTTGIEATIEQIQAGERFGVFVVSTHGDTVLVDSTLLPVLQHIDPTGEVFGAYPHLEQMPYLKVLYRGTPEAAHEKYELEMSLGQLIVVDVPADGATLLGITPRYVRDHMCFEDTIVYISCCRSAYNANLANAFLEAGASAFVGYDGYVNVGFAYDKGVELFQGLCEGKTIGEAFVEGSDSAGVSNVLFGQHDARLPAAGVNNGSFESDLVHWSSDQARVTRRLGEINPYQPDECNRRMGEIFSGGYLETAVCVPETATTLTFLYDFVSQGLKDHIIFPEEVVRFEVKVGVSKVLDIDSSSVSSEVTVVDAGYGDSFSDQDGKTWHTGWKTHEVDVEHLRGKIVKIRFETSASDASSRTSILIDKVAIGQEEPDPGSSGGSGGSGGASDGSANSGNSGP